MIERRLLPWHVVVAASTAAVVAIGVRALLSLANLFPVVEWGLAILAGCVVGLVVANVVRGLARRR